MKDYVKSLQPNNKKQQEEYERYVKHLNLKTDGEKFILLCVLNFDWRRQKILQSIKYIKESEDGRFIKFYITMRAPITTAFYSIDNPYHEEGWSLKTLYERQQRTYSQMDYYTNNYYP